MTGPRTNPLESNKARLACAAIVFLIALAIYSLTLAPTVTLVDSGELIVAARELGVAHPPGFPLYILLAHLASVIPIGSVAARVNFASAVFAALAAGALTLAVIEARLAISQLPRRKTKPEKRSIKSKKTKKQTPSKEPEIERDAPGALAWIIAFAPPVVAGCLFAFGRTLWSYATIAEVYTLNALLIIVIFLLMFRWRRTIVTRAQEDRKTRGRGDAETRRQKSDDAPDTELLDKNISPRLRVPASPRHGMLYIAALVFGLALGVHHVTVGLMILALAYLVFAAEGAKFFTSKRLLFAALAAFAGLSIYLYLPAAASSSPVMNWGDPDTIERFWWHVTGKQYQVFFSPSLEVMIRQFPKFLRLAIGEFGPLWMPVGLALALSGFVAAFKRDRTLFWFLILVIVGNLVYALNYEIAEDKDAYYLPCFIAMAIAAGLGAQWIIENAQVRSLQAKLTRYAALALIMLVPVVALAGNLSYNDRSRYFIAKDYVENVFKTIEPKGMLLTGDWQLYSPMFYLQQAERERTDVVSIDIKMLRRSWYYDYLSRAYPRLIEATRDKVNAFLEDLRNWEQNPGLYDRDLRLNQRINARFYDMILSFISSHLETGPVYVAHDIGAGVDPQDAELTKSLSARYQLVPQGLVFQAVTDSNYHEPARPQLITRGLNDKTIKFDDEDTVKLKVLPVYFNMLYNRGRYLAANNRHEQAVEAFKQALEIDPGNAHAKQSLDASQGQLQRSNPAGQN